MEITLNDVVATVMSQANALASAWSAAGEAFVKRAAEEGGRAKLTAAH